MAKPIPGFTDEGLLPPGDYEVTFEELRESILVTGPGSESPWGEEWDTDWREHLTWQAETMCTQLWEVGIRNVFLDGLSFPRYDGHFRKDECPGVVDHPSAAREVSLEG